MSSYQPQVRYSFNCQDKEVEEYLVHTIMEIRVAKVSSEERISHINTTTDMPIPLAKDQFKRP